MLQVVFDRSSEVQNELLDLTSGMVAKAARTVGDSVSGLDGVRSQVEISAFEAEVTVSSEQVMVTEFGSAVAPAKPFVLPAAEQAGQALDRAIGDF